VRFNDIVDEINKQDNPEQSLDSYFCDIRTREIDYTEMDLVKFKKVIK